MQSKSTRGVQQDDVWEAADALIAQGLRPTIERVRQKIGRGSPNTVSPMLETWFATLGPRLGVDASREKSDDLPQAVRQAMTQFWAVALATSQQQAQDQIKQATQVLDEERAALAAREIDLAQQQRVQMEAQAAATDALAVARSQGADLAARLEESQMRLARRDAEVQDFRDKLDVIGKLRDAERRHSEEETQRHAQERNSMAEQSTADQRRLLAEVDRARQQVKRAESALSDYQRNTQTSIQNLELTNKALGEKLVPVEAELRATHVALASANDRAIEMRALLQQEQASRIAALAQIERLKILGTRNAKLGAGPKRLVPRRPA